MSMFTHVTIYTQLGRKAEEVAAALRDWNNPGGCGADFGTTTPTGGGMASDNTVVAGTANHLNDIPGMLAVIAEVLKDGVWQSFDTCAVITHYEDSENAPHTHRLDQHGHWTSTGGY